MYRNEIEKKNNPEEQEVNEMATRENEHSEWKKITHKMVLGFKNVAMCAPSVPMKKKPFLDSIIAAAAVKCQLLNSVYIMLSGLRRSLGIGI